MKQIDTVLSDFPGGRYAYYARYLQGQCHEAMGNPARAADAYAQVVLGFPEARFADRRLRRDARYRLASANQAAGRYSRAADEYIEAIREYPDDPRAATARMSLAECRRMAGDFDLAVGDYQLFLEDFPDHPAATQARMRLADAHLAYYDYDSARRQFAEVARGGSDSATEVAALAGVAESFEAEARTASATDAGRLLLSAERGWELVLERQPVDPEPLARMAVIAERRGDLDGAYKHLARYVAALPAEATAAPSRLRMGQLASRMDRWDEVYVLLAEPPADGALAPEPTTRWNLLAAEALRRRGETEKAVERYQRALVTAQPGSLLADEIARQLKDLEYRQEATRFTQAP
jgi:TolA-binding protein